MDIRSVVLNAFMLQVILVPACQGLLSILNYQGNDTDLTGLGFEKVLPGCR